MHRYLAPVALCLLVVLAFAATASAATFEVNSTNDVDDATCDAGHCSLREAIAAANASANSGGNDEIAFAAHVIGAIALTAALPQVTEGVDIVGPGAGVLTIDGQDSVRALDIATSGAGSVLIEGLTITRGVGPGGAIRAVDNLSVEIRDATLSDCSGTGGADGGAVHASASPLTIDDSTLSGNSTAGIAAQGGAIYASAGDLTITGSTFSGNSTADTSSNGGAISTSGAVDLQISGSTLSGNSTGGLSANGGAINVNSGGSLAISNSTVSGNETTGGSANGGAINSSSPVTIANSTVSGNATLGSSANAGGVHVSGAALTISSSTIAGNSTAGGTANGGGLYANSSDPALTNTIVRGNTAGGAGDDLYSSTNPGDTYTADHSLIGTTADAEVDISSGDNIVGVDPQLGALADNGGPTETHALPATSPAIDAGDTAEATDQRGVARPQGAADDIGAFERVLDPPDPGPGPGDDPPDTTPPPPLADNEVQGVRVSARKRQRQRGRRIVVRVRVGAAEAVDGIARGFVFVRIRPKSKLASAGASILQHKRVRLRRVTKSTAAGERAVYRLVLRGKRANRRLFSLLRRGTRLRTLIVVTLADEAGNRASVRRTVRLTAKRRR